MTTAIDENSALLSVFNGSKEANLTATKAMSIASTTIPYVYKGKIYAIQLRTSNIVLKIDGNNGTLTTNDVQMELGPNNLFPGSPIFKSETKAYLPLTLTGELAVFNPTTMTIITKLDLSSYAKGDGDINPEPITGIIRDEKLYLALWQAASLEPFTCRGMASMVIIDTDTDKVEKYIEDNRTCMSGTEGTDNGIFIDEKNDIYIYNPASYQVGNPDKEPGFLRIKKDQSDFDPDYFFSIPKLENLPVEGGKASFFYQGAYGENGKYYTSLAIPTLVSSPPDYVNDKIMQPFVLDLYNKSADKIDLPATTPWGSAVLKYKGKYLYGLMTDSAGVGIFRYDPITKEADKKPFINTVGIPMALKNLK